MPVIRSAMNIIGMGVFVGATATLGTIILSEQFPEIPQGIETLRCWAGYPSERDKGCVESELSALKQKQRVVEQQRDSLAKKIRDQEQREAELKLLSEKVQNFNLFHTANLKFGQVSTGAKFASVLEPEAWSDSWCYLKRTHNGLERHVSLGKREPGKAIAWETLGSDKLSDAGITDAMLQEAKDACQFPDDA